MIAPQVTRLARRHRHHVESGSAEQRGKVRWHPVQTRVVASADFGKHERREVAIGARKIEVEIDRSYRRYPGRILARFCFPVEPESRDSDCDCRQERRLRLLE